jgi:Flp pilus assembly pilin Flp
LETLMFPKLQWLIHSEDGQDLLEYAVLASLIALACIGVAGMLGNHLYTFFWQNIGPSI